MKQKQLIEEFKTIVGEENVLTDQVKTKYYRSGFRSGSGTALAVVFPNTLLEQWKREVKEEGKFTRYVSVRR